MNQIKKISFILCICSVCSTLITPCINQNISAETIMMPAVDELQKKTCSDYGYQSLDLLNNTENKQALYNRMLSSMEDFWNNTEDALNLPQPDTGNIYIIDVIQLDEFDLSFDDVSAVYEIFWKDNPLFYFASDTIISFTLDQTGPIAFLICPDEFASGAQRAVYQEQIVTWAESYADCVEGKSAYSDAKAIHDRMINGMDFAYSEDGIKPADDGFSHCILGAVNGAGVSEAYAKAYQLLCNYYDIPTLCVSGMTNGAHIWNLSRLDDGAWYFVDCMDDDLNSTTGTDYFAVGTETLQKTHTLFTIEEMGADYFDLLPQISISDYGMAQAIQKGDVNGDSRIDMNDCGCLRLWLLGTGGITEDKWKNADMNSDGRLDASDLSELKQRLLRNI